MQSANKCLNVSELVEVVRVKQKNAPPLLSSELSVSGKENPDRKKNIYLVKVNNRNTRKRRETCSKLSIKTPERRH